MNDQPRITEFVVVLEVPPDVVTGDKHGNDVHVGTHVSVGKAEEFRVDSLRVAAFPRLHQRRIIFNGFGQVLTVAESTKVLVVFYDFLEEFLRQPERHTSEHGVKWAIGIFEINSFTCEKLASNHIINGLQKSAEVFTHYEIARIEKFFLR